MQELLIEKIRTDGDVQSRERISDDYVEELADLIKAEKKLPPIDVFNDGTDIWVSDGYHRLHAHLKANKRTIRCDVKKGTKAAAMLASCAANQAHGLRRTNADKRRAMEMTLKLKPDWSDQAVANHAGVHVNTVALTRRQLPQNVGVERTGVDGKTRKIPPPSGVPKPTKEAKLQGDTPKKIPPPGQLAVGSGQKAAGDPHPHPLPSQGEGVKKTPPLPPPPQPEVRVDGVKKPIPDHLIPLFDRGGEVQALLSQITSIKGVLKKARETDDPLFGECHFQAAEAALQTAYTEIKATKPFAVCPWCGGTMSNECRGCGQRGVVGEFRWSQHVPEEFKK